MRWPTGTAAPDPGSDRVGGGGRIRGEGQRGWARPPEFVRAVQPISSSVLPFVSFTNLRTNGMESAAKTV
ncbi:hypothetical protein QF037_002980 [Streptomyces canus]|nr:hypothetical protein [Streptomyces canus]